MTKHTNDQKISRKVLNVSINKDAYHKLHELSEIEGIKKWQMLSRIIIQSIRNKHYKVNERWVNDLLNPVNRTIKYKGTKGRKQISYQISEAAWNKLECHKTASGKSKARIVQSIILYYTFQTPEQLAKQKEGVKRREQERREWRLNRKPPTQEEIDKMYKDYDAIAAKREKAQDEFWNQLKDRAVERLSDKEEETS